MQTETILWIVFAVVIIIMLALDLGVFNKKAHVIRVKEALIWSGIWISIGMLFFVGIYFFLDNELGLQYLATYLIEKSLSMDNIFVFFLLFSYFNLPAENQHKVLFWGILGALFFRGIFIWAGAAIILQFHWVIYIMSVFLIYTGIKLLVKKERKMNPEKMFAVRMLKKIFPVSDKYYKDKFFINMDKHTHATMLFVTLVAVEFTDIIFAVDSIPAALSISQDPFIVFTSNVFAIMGLRSLYFVLAGVIDKLRFLKFGLCLILVFIGVKMFLHDIYKISTLFSLGVIVSVLILSIISSLLIKEKKNELNYEI